jgi:tRNA pseudouridine55 synthase
VVDKPAGVTSAKVVAMARAKLRQKRVGHTGTLDPMATGVLALVVGEATKLAGFLLADDKTYEGELELGVATDTLDADGQVVATDADGAAAVTREALETAVAALCGPLAQIPPMYSALKRGGRPLHELARKGEHLELAAREVTVHEFVVLDFSPPRVRFRVACTKGTYVRALARDLGVALGCGAHLTALRRIRAGMFTLEDAISLEDVTADAPLVALPPVLTHLPSFSVAAELVHNVASGQDLLWERISPAPAPGGELVLLTPGGDLLAVARVERDRLRYERVFTYGVDPRPKAT